MRKIIIDTDPGIDDAFAIITALLAKDIQVLGLCSVAGNKGLDITTKNCSRLIEYLNYDCLVYEGAKSSLTKDICVDKDSVCHGANGLGGVDLVDNPDNISSTKAEDFILEMVKKYPNEVEILAIGPLTNVALAVLKDPVTMENVKSIYSMGGGINKGNITPDAEFNYWYDPKAVNIVFNLKKPLKYMVGLDITHQVIFSCNDLFYLKKTVLEIGELLVKMSEYYVERYWEFNHYTGCVIHDLVALTLLLNPDICPDLASSRYDLTTLETTEKIGKTLIKPNALSNTFVPLTIDAKKVKQTFMRVLAKEQEQEFLAYLNR